MAPREQKSQAGRLAFQVRQPRISARAEAQALHEQLLCMIHERQAEVAAAAVKGIGDEL